MAKQSLKYRDEDRSLDLYLREIGEIPLIKRHEEARLARRRNRGDTTAVQKLAKANLRFVVSVAKQYQNQGLSLADLIGEGSIGLMKAAKRFDETRGFKFISYAVWWIRQTIVQALTEQSRIVRLPVNRLGDLCKIGKVAGQLEQEQSRQPTPDEIANRLELSEDEVEQTLAIQGSCLLLDDTTATSGEITLLDVLEDDFQPSPETVFLNSELRVLIDKALDSLTAREAEVINLYFGVNQPTPFTLEEIGEQLSLTRERVRQIKIKALRRLRHVSRSRELEPFLYE